MLNANYNSRSNLNRHKQEVHCKETQIDTSRIKVSLYSFVCNQCSFVTKWNSHLLRHVKNKHNTDDQSKDLKIQKKSKYFATNQIWSVISCQFIRLKVHKVSDKMLSWPQHLSGTNPKRWLRSSAITVKKNFIGSNFWRHIEEVHNKTKYYTALTEVSSFPHVCELKENLTLKDTICKSLCDLTFPCEKCGKVFHYENSL